MLARKNKFRPENTLQIHIEITRIALKKNTLPNIKK